MKFLGGIHKYVLEEDQIRFRIPVFHRTALGLLPGEVKIYSLPKKTARNGVEVKEIIFSSFKPKDWQHLWKIELTTEDRPGILRDVTEIISNNDINISIQESSIESYNKDFNITLFLDCKSFIEKHKLNNSNLEEIKKKIVEILSSDYKAHDYKGFTIVRFEPVEFLRVNCPLGISESDNLISPSKLNEYDESEKFIDIEDSGALILKKSILNDLEIFNDKTQKILEGTTFSDTEEKYLILRFFSKEQYVINIDVVHRDRVGMINSFTKKIMEVDPGFNIINCYNRIETVSHIAHWYSLIDVSTNPDRITHLINILKADDSEVQEVRVLNYTNNIEHLYADIPESLELFKKRKEKTKRQEKINQLSQIIENKIPSIEGSLKEVSEQLSFAKIENESLKTSLSEVNEYNDYQDRLINTARYLTAALFFSILLFSLDNLDRLIDGLKNSDNFQFMGNVGDVLGLVAMVYGGIQVLKLYLKSPKK